MYHVDKDIHNIFALAIKFALSVFNVLCFYILHFSVTIQLFEMIKTTVSWGFVAHIDLSCSFPRTQRMKKNENKVKRAILFSSNLYDKTLCGNRI